MKCAGLFCCFLFIAWSQTFSQFHATHPDTAKDAAFLSRLNNLKQKPFKKSDHVFPLVNVKARVEPLAKRAAHT